MEKGRRRQIPVFGEWNQHCEELPMTQYFESAMQAGLVRAGHYYYHGAAVDVVFRASSSSPPPHKPAKKVRSSRRDGMESQVVVARRRRQGPSVADGVAHAPRRPRMVRAVDEDLYKVPPEMLRKKGKNVRSLWMGCVGLNCVA